MHYKIAPSLLIAPPTLSDPSFENAVIAVAMHESDGAMGFIINRRSDLRLHDLLADLAVTAKVPDKHVLFGGPVSKDSGFILYEHASGKPIAEGLPLTKTISISPSRELLEKAAAGKLPGRFELVLGYAGWGAEQLEEEIKGGGWLNTSAFNEIFFDIPIPDRWHQSFAQIGVSPLGFVSVPGGAYA